MKLPKIIGHRGACGYAPENTLESIRTAAEIGATWVEMDVKLSKDCVPIILHDDTLERTTNGSGKVADTLYTDIEALDAGAWYAESFAGAKVPTLEEAVDVILELGLGLNLEIKPCPGREVETAEAALDVLSRIWDDADKLLISSFQHVSLESAREMAPEWRRGLLIDTPMRDWAALADYLKVSTINIDGRDLSLTREGVEAYLESGLGVLAYTINDPMRARTLFSWGVDGVFSDVPDAIEGSLNLRH
ncbi:MAG: glycerophosphoryl diester phosphodiesterase [Rhodospirillales bacterium]|nr:glycerophosphoryl diester phosphodiesterase [Alphaproteobacteria bacterium]MCB9987465.1 glycerophosphoryl diester phosphodiesterase [Rhodospirillales bacterium]USO07556.1 MAG: glycerophosphoryl diester phosphodiesterase [Rhodospirillales bacterium]